MQVKYCWTEEVEVIRLLRVLVGSARLTWQYLRDVTHGWQCRFVAAKQFAQPTPRITVVVQFFYYYSIHAAYSQRRITNNNEVVL